jgi:predicted transcriptional regulator
MEVDIMSSTVQQLIDGGQKLITVLREDTAKKALELMVENDYSQLPVVDHDGKIQEERGKAYIITNDSILRTLRRFGTSITDPRLRVSDAMIKTNIFRADSDLFELLNDLQDVCAVLIVDGDHKLTGIVTNYDTNRYFRQKAEDMMLVEDVEEALKKYILAAFPIQDGETNQELSKAIGDVMPSNKDMQGRFQKALLEYLHNGDSHEVKLQKDLADQAFQKHMYVKEAPKPFDRLTFNHYIDLFLHESRWERYSSIFSLDRKHIRNLLQTIRDIRNNLAHFRSTVSRQQHDDLLACKEWLERYEAEVLKEFEPKQLSTSLEISYTITESSADDFAPVEEAIHANESRYASLALRLQEQPRHQTQVQLTFQQVEEIIKGELPVSARQHRSWWANDSVGHVQSQQWLDVGWRVSRINMSEETVIFTRIQEREKAYIHFFSELFQRIKEKSLSSKQLSPDGTNWMRFALIPEEGSPVASLVFSFARYGRFRVELYIDTHDPERNKRIFDGLYERKQAIQTELGEMADALEWERIDKKIASRIALYHPGSITDNNESLTDLREWAIEAMSCFQPVMEKYVNEVLGTLVLSSK